MLIGVWGFSLSSVFCFVPSKEGLCLTPAGQVHSRGLGQSERLLPLTGLGVGEECMCG